MTPKYQRCVVGVNEVSDYHVFDPRLTSTTKTEFFLCVEMSEWRRPNV